MFCNRFVIKRKILQRYNIIPNRTKDNTSVLINFKTEKQNYRYFCIKVEYINKYNLKVNIIYTLIFNLY